MNIKNILASSLGRPNSIKTVAVLLVAFALARSATAQTGDRQISFVGSPPNSVFVVGSPSSATLKVSYTPLDKIIIDEFEKSAPIGQLLQDLTQAWYDLAKQNGDTDIRAEFSTSIKLEKKLADMEAQTKAKPVRLSHKTRSQIMN